MSEREEKRGGAGCAIGLVALLFLLPVLYVLSIGPVCVMIGGDTSPPMWVELASRECRIMANRLARLGLLGLLAI